MQQQAFPCSRCGSQNLIGQPFCQNCGQQFQYNCPHCRASVDSRFSICPNCRAPLNWLRQQQAQPVAPVMKVAEKKTSPWLIGFLALIGVAVLIGGGIFAIDRFSQGTLPTVPPTSMPPTQTPAIKNTDAAKLVLTQADMKSDGWILDHESKPPVPGSLSTHSVTFTKTGEYFHMEVYTFATDSNAERNYSDSKFNEKDRIAGMVEIVDEGYFMKNFGPTAAPIPGEVIQDTYGIFFLKHNVVVTMWGIPDYEEILSYAKIVEARIQ